MYIKSKPLIIVIGIGFIILGIYLIFNPSSKNCTESTMATILGVEDRCTNLDCEDEVKLDVLVEYNVDGKVITGTNPVVVSSTQFKIGPIQFSDYRTKYKKGNIIKIYYNPNNINEFIIRENNWLMIFAGGFAILSGGIMIVAGIIAAIKKD